MDIEAALLRALNQPGPHSGSRLGETLGISRVAVQKRLAGLREQGLPLEAVSGSGYQLSEGVRLLDIELIQGYLDEPVSRLLTDLIVERETTSTNQVVQQQGLQEGRATVCLAESQSAGRGRRDASWVATPYRNLLFSLGWRFAGWPTALPGLSLLVGLVTCQVLELLDVDGLQIKWPNDIYRHGKKVGGILVQASGEASGYCDLVVGLGLNLYLDEATRHSIDQPCTDLSDLAVPLDRNQIAALLIEGLVDVLPVFAEQGFAPFREAWEQRALYLGEPVSVRINGSEQRGTMLGVDDQGALVFKPESGSERRFTEADISLRPI